MESTLDSFTVSLHSANGRHFACLLGLYKGIVSDLYKMLQILISPVSLNPL